VRLLRKYEKSGDKMEKELKYLLVFAVSLASVFGGLILMLLKPYPKIISSANVLGGVVFALGMSGLLYVTVRISE
jgi:hypothetical protein